MTSRITTWFIFLLNNVLLVLASTSLLTFNTLLNADDTFFRLEEKGDFDRSLLYI